MFYMVNAVDGPYCTFLSQHAAISNWFSELFQQVNIEPCFFSRQGFIVVKRYIRNSPCFASE